MKVLYLILTLFVSVALTEQVQAQHLNKQETQQLKKYFDKHLLNIFASAKLKAESNLQRNSNFSSLSDSIHTFAKFAEGDAYAPGFFYYFTFQVIGDEAIITNLDIKNFDTSLPIDNIRAIPAYDDQQRISKITMTGVVFGIPANFLNYYFNYDDNGNTISTIYESPGIFGNETTYQGDSVQFTYGAGNRVAAYNVYSRLDSTWIFTRGISDLSYDGNGNLTELTEWESDGDTLAPTPIRANILRNIEWYNNSMPSIIINPLGYFSDEFETELTGIEIVSANEDYKLSPVAFIQASYIDGVLEDSIIVRTFEEVANRFSILDAYYETGDYIYTQVHNYLYDSEDQLASHEIIYLGFGDDIPLEKIDYEHGDYGLTKSEEFIYDQGEWISQAVSTYDFVVVDGELLEYTETDIFDNDYASYKNVFFPSDILETSVNETLLSQDVINVYPTVVKGNLTINFPQKSFIQDVKVSVWNPSGQLLQAQRFDAAAENIDFNVSKLTSGIYFLNVQTPDGMRTVRFIKE